MKGVLMKFENYTDYTSELCHTLKRMGDIHFLNDILNYVDIDVLLKTNRKKHALYTVAMIDYISKENNVPIKHELDKYRKLKMETLSYPEGVETYTRIVKCNDMKEKTVKSAIKEFLIYNIVESSVRNVS